MDLQNMMRKYQKEGLSRPLASARVCQDIILKAIADSEFNRNVTIKGGVVMRSITDNNRRATRDIDLDFIHYSLSNASIQTFVQRINVINGLEISIVGDIEELKHQDYHGKSISVRICDERNYSITTKIDIGVHKHFDIEQDEYRFEVAMSEEGVCLLKNSCEQAFTEKLRSLLIFGPNSHRYKDIYDLCYLKDIVDAEKLDHAIRILIFADEGMRENNYSDIIKRVEKTFANKDYMQEVANSWQRWLDEDVESIATGIMNFLQNRRNIAESD